MENIMSLRVNKISDNSIKRYQENAKNAYFALNSKFKPSSFDVRDYRRFLGDIINNPTKAKLAIREQEKKSGRSAFYEINKMYMEKNIRDVSMLSKTVKSRINELYPRTKTLRQYIIENDRVVLDEVKRSKGYNILNRLAILIKKTK